jgi:hypothetical protein
MPMQNVLFKMKPASAVLGVTTKDLQNIVQLGVIRPIRRNWVCLFDANLLLAAKVAFYLKDSLGSSSRILARFSELLIRNLGKAGGPDLRDISFRSRPSYGREAIEIKIPVRALARELEEQLALAAYGDSLRERKQPGGEKAPTRVQGAASAGAVSGEEIPKAGRVVRVGRKKQPEITLVARKK